MESVAIALYALGGMVAAPVFCFVVSRYAALFPRLSDALWWAALALFATFTMEVAWVDYAGALRVRAVVGAAFFPIHAFITFFAAPALAFLLLANRRNFSRWWPAVAVIAWLLGVFAIFYQYNVSETLYGIDGRGGPYSS
jgi:hypothetical protein